MNQTVSSAISNNNLRRLQGWARAVYPIDSSDRCAVIVQYLAQLDDEASAALIKAGWPEVAATAERAWPEAFAGWTQKTAQA